MCSNENWSVSGLEKSIMLCQKQFEPVLLPLSSIKSCAIDQKQFESD
jgi:hypothetical protein